MRRCLLALLLLAGCAGPPIDYPDDDPQAPRVATVYVIENDWHTEIALPASGITGPLALVHTLYPGARYLGFGFGERRYYQLEESNVGDMLLALLPGRGLMAVGALDGTPPALFPHEEIATLDLTQAQLDRLADFIWDSFEKTPDGRLVKVNDAKVPNYFFYAAATTYYGAYTCNTWTVQALDVAGLHAGAGGILFARQVMDRVESLPMARRK
jgi:uncharacterized protein (TIGR02117 family)